MCCVHPYLVVQRIGLGRHGVSLSQSPTPGDTLENGMPAEHTDVHLVYIRFFLASFRLWVYI